ncbi:MAG TPA: DUF3617 domain-containing protein [Paucimonas sp.]|nr:DUF3617 domain-containing protein [Paucimonas sp.]
MKNPVLVSLLLCCSAAAFAAGPMKPGLWEMSIKSDMMKNMPKIPPEQMEKMKQMGVNIPHMQDGGMVTKVCITKEMAERDQPPEMNQKEAGCEARNYQRTGSGYSVDIICDGPVMKGQGKAQGSFSGSESFTSVYDFKGTAQGRPVNQHQETKGKWLSADCGNVAPMGQMGRPGKQK